MEVELNINFDKPLPCGIRIIVLPKNENLCKRFKQRPLLRGVLIQTVENLDTSFVYTAAHVALPKFLKRKNLIGIINTAVEYI